MFLLLVLLTRLGELHADPHPDKTFLETTIPEKISSSDAKTDPENNVGSTMARAREKLAKTRIKIAYIITIKGKPYFVHLRKHCLDHHFYLRFLLFTYMTKMTSNILSLCQLRGTLQLKNISYGIEPMEAVSGFVHMIYEEKNDNTNIPLLGENKTYSYNNLYYHIRRSSEFDYMGSDIKVVTQKIIQIIVFKKHPTFIGATFPGKICNKNYAVGVALYPEDLSLESYTISIVQLLGFNLGLSYDNPDTCYCSEDVCTMSPKAVQSRGVKDFSTCTLDDFKYLASHSGFGCLQRILPEMPVYKQQKKRTCGNGQLEQGEQCDCGTVKNCTHKDCCDPKTCTMKANKQCGSGECCTQDCKLKSIGIQCRKSYDECDFTEYCNGVSPHCMPDTYARNGQSCDSGDSFCYKGRCRIFTKQCKELIGGASRGAPFACYDEVNSRGDRYGNCGRNHCSYAHLLCGKLVCAWPHKELVSRANLSVIYTHVREEMCVSTYRNQNKGNKNPWTTIYSPEERDDTFVEDGSVCGPDMYCVNFNCVEIQYQVNYQTCNSSHHCNSHGICNNLNHCHCQNGFAPPECLEKKGEFGSIDDGHIPPYAISSKVSQDGRLQVHPGAMEEEAVPCKSDLGGRSTTPSKHRFELIFYISLPLLIITAAVVIKQNKIRELCYRGETESDRNLCQKKAAVTANYPPVKATVCNNIGLEKGHYQRNPQKLN
ncbi:disintegrin and metalloproteinase domain-containing protein 5-like isoform X1 [Prionailurus iriomotensis]